MDESEKKPLIDPTYEQEVKLKVDLVKNVYANCLKKLINGTDNTATSSKLRATRYTGIPESVYPNPQPKKIKLSNVVKMKIRPIIEEIIQDQYLNKRVLPVLKHIFNANRAWMAAVKKTEITKTQLSVLLNKNNLPTVMTKLGFKWQLLPATDKKFIIECPEYVNARHKYLKCLTKCRNEHRSIIYLDVFNLTEKMEENWSKTSLETDLEANYVVIAIFPAVGMLYKNHCGRNVDAAILETIVKVGLVKDTAEDSVIIFGDDHGVMGDLYKTPTTSSNRSEMISFLEHSEIPYSKDMHKCELFDLCKNFTSTSPRQERWEAILAAHGRLVLKRPRWMHDFGIFHEFWPNMKSDNRLTKFKLVKNFQVFIGHVQLTEWDTLDETLMKKEAKSMNMDKLIEDMIENVLAMVKNNGLSHEDLASNDFDNVLSSDEEM